MNTDKTLNHRHKDSKARFFAVFGGMAPGSGMAAQSAELLGVDSMENLGQPASWQRKHYI